MNTIRPYHRKNRFYNDEHQHTESFWFGTVPSFISSFVKRKRVDVRETKHWIHHETLEPISDTPRITWLGHATFLIQIGGVNILTDPIFGDLFLFPRILPNVVSLETMPRIDVVLISHNHRDHMDASSLLALKKQFEHMQILVPWGDKAWFDARGFTHITEYMWWESLAHQIMGGNTLNYTFLPAWHWSQRGLFDKNKSLWGSWMIEHNGYTIYFAGDTAYASHFKAIADKFPSIHVALMPIGPCEPRPWMRRSHVDASEACQAFIDLQAQTFIPMHWGTFPFGQDHFALPIERLQDAWASHTELSSKQLLMPKVGQSLVFESIAPHVLPYDHKQHSL